MSLHESPDNTPELQALKTKLKATWMAGDFGQIAKLAEPAAREFVRRQNLGPGMQVLDVACGTGNTSLPAALTGACVTGADIADNLVEQARMRAKDEGVKVNFEEGDAEQLPYSDATFDVVLSMFGAMFAPRPDRVTSELLRVCKPGGRIVMANWTPRGFVGQVFKATAKHVSPPPGIQPAVLWGDEDTVRQRFGDRVDRLLFTPVSFQLNLPFSVPDSVEFYRLYYGPTARSFAALPEDKQPFLRRDLEAAFGQFNRANDGTTSLEAQYLEVVALKKTNE
jgi:SAM-dependent methyltransferase